MTDVQTEDKIDQLIEYRLAPLRERIEALERAAQPQSPGITDEMCEAAVKASQCDRIQGFSYNTNHVIRDVWIDPGEQIVWEMPKDAPGAEDKFYQQCRIERMRKVLEAALSVSRPDRQCK